MESGEVLWETPNEKGWQMSHSSVMPYEFGGKKMYVYSAFGAVFGVAAEGPKLAKSSGKLQPGTTRWWPPHRYVCPTERYF
jgi:outer membrane protein assembly factor BamB